MRRWGIGFLLVLLACVPIYLNRGTGPDLLRDTDTHVLIQAIRKRHQPLSWFTSDWPLENHFYRPLPTLTFEMDNALYGDNAAGYGRTNALLAIACVLLLYWFFREITNSPTVSTASTCLFAFWTGGYAYTTIGALVGYLSWGALLFLLGFWLYRLLFAKSSKAPERPASLATISSSDGVRLKYAAAAFFTLVYASIEINSVGITQKGIEQLSTSMIAWLPGRTASVMGVFVLIAMATYARYERTSAERLPLEPSPLDPPATKGTQVLSRPRAPWIWALLAILSAALAFASYEQAVMLPAALFGVAVSLRLQRYKVRWAWQIPFWAMFLAYLLARKEFIPHGVSQYQLQQYRHGSGVFWAILNYVFPSGMQAWQTLSVQEFSVFLLIQTTVWSALIALVANVVAFVSLRKRLAFALTGWALSVVAFLPMAWTKPFEHYDFWPMAMRSLLVATVCWVGFDLLVNAVSRPALQAPSRLDPAPGSLPRP